MKKTLTFTPQFSADEQNLPEPQLDEDFSSSEDYMPDGISADYGEPDLAKFFSRDIRFTRFSPYEMLYLSITDPESERRMNGFVRTGIRRAAKENRIIRETSDPELLMEIMKGEPDILNHIQLVDSLLATGKGLGMILDELRNDNGDWFYWIAAKALYQSGAECSDEIIDAVENGCMRAYPVSVMSLLLGFYESRAALKCVWKNYNLLKDFFPGRMYHEGPLFGLVAAFNRRKNRGKKLAI